MAYPTKAEFAASMSHFLRQIMALIQPSSSRDLKKHHASSPTTVSELELDPDILVLKGADIDGNEKVIEAVLEEAVDIFSSSECHCIEDEASLNMLPNVKKRIASMHKRLGNVYPDSPCPYGYKQTCKTFPVHAQIESAVEDKPIKYFHSS